MANDEIDVSPQDLGDAENNISKKSGEIAALLLGTIFYFDVRLGEYVHRRNGRTIQSSEYYKFLDILSNKQTLNYQKVLSGYTEKLINERQMRSFLLTELKRSHIQSTALGAGGFDNINREQVRALERFLGREARFLSNSLDELVTGEISEAEMQRRLSMYGNHIQESFFEARTIAKIEAGFTEMKRKAVGDHFTCLDCSDYAGAGWVRIGDLPMPGADCVCGSNCRCTVDYR